MLSEDELWEYLHHKEGIPVTRRTIKWAVLRREIVPTRLGNKNLFSKRDALNWLASRRQTGPYRAPKAAAFPAAK
ncbi:hypothetical protein MKUB_54020 [Mycobacterium kubicae]|uniref:DNA-binding protein n=1 Tax=Mycobacterium kubicae TaxID=120959 RepID=A0AAX1J6G8_9MYCO|nr:hypothetical protein [Mycobacterium kubicae]MCV7097502.1 hypothetical protein [Mycobacterium kubicae]ORV96455.1 hypothetical protein AWC13_18605 [Mycobacterium kubicae]QNI12681.1 hypothetical protein GAN18_17030 [Mycobacterium kubicae]QPI36202.1 hypothetical protein I2456_16810 [Mycobacterium kubicae]GFG67912.1 hypothetical protein MKUB_54020 [Mycobacterium kubicae]